ncbi:hypothetical protein OSB04_031767 [Centaurea solstitialis]|uniref:Uncharacterized protein n=1 Tax=Centaurea solstitialis TaxID=347529 RepID=A0AA38SBD5_9ASTR|nr:hypothetical protein OSB04_031767 [Centaurea solstitialis]
MNNNWQMMKPNSCGVFNYFMDRKRQRVMEKQGSLKLKQTMEGNKIVGPKKEILKKSSLQKPRSKRPHELVQMRRTNFWLQDEDSPDEDLHVHETMQPFSPNTSNVRQASCSNVTTRNQNEDFQELEHEVELEVNSETYTDSQEEENNETRALSDTRKSRLGKGKLVFEVDECAGRIIGEHSQRFITKGGCIVREHAKFDGTTWRNQPGLLKVDIINKCMENSTFDGNSELMVRAINTQLASSHRNKQYRLHTHYKKFSTKYEAMRHPPIGIKVPDWVNLCERFACENFQKNRSFNEVPPAVGTVSIARIVDMVSSFVKNKYLLYIFAYLVEVFCNNYLKQKRRKGEQNELQSEAANSSSTPIEICLKKLRRISSYIKVRSASTKQSSANENLRMELKLEKERSKALEEEGHEDFMGRRCLRWKI